METKIHITDNLDAEQLKCLNEIKTELKVRLEIHPNLYTNWNIIRFCRARNFNFKKVKLMIENYLEFREKYDFKIIEAIEESDLDVIFQNYAKGYFGYDYEGRVVIIDKLSLTYPSKIFDAMDIKFLTKALIRLYMHLIHIIFPVLSNLHKKRIDKMFYLVDLKDVSIMKFFDKRVLAFMKILSHFASDYYPEILGKCFIINSPLLFKGIWNVCKMWLDKKTRDKFDIEGEPGKEKLETYLNIVNLPICVGGKSENSFNLLNGPWKKELTDAIERRSFYLRDRTIEYEYFYTNEERDSEMRREKINKDNEISKFAIIDKDVSKLNDKNLVKYLVTKSADSKDIKKIGHFQVKEFEEFSTDDLKFGSPKIPISSIKVCKKN
jgi:hypothetical protein